MEDEQVLLEPLHDFHTLDGVDNVLRLLLDECINLINEDFLFHPDVEERADLSPDEEKSNEDGEQLNELILLLASLLLLDVQQEVPHAVLEHLVEDALIVELHLHGLHALQGRHLHAHPHHHLAEVVVAVLGHLEDAAGGFLGEDGGAEGGEAGVDGAGPQVLAEEELVDVEFFLEVGAEFVEAVLADGLHLGLVLLPEGGEQLLEVLLDLPLEDGQRGLERGVGLRLALLVLVHDLDGVVVLLLLDVQRGLLRQLDKALHNQPLT